MITCNELKSFPKKENEKQEKQGNAFKLDILLQLGVCSIIFSCLNPFDCLDFLMAYPRLYFNETGWLVLATSCGLREHESTSRKYFIDYCLRKFVIHAIRRLGYNCELCHRPLNGPHGLFACSSYCNPCALDNFRRDGDPFVEGTIRFYLAGEESVVSRGRAFVNSPYWVCIDDCSSQVLHSHSSVFELAQRLYEEKVFFNEHVPKDLTQRPRDDKGHAIRCMLRRLRELELCPTVAPAPNPSLIDDYDDGVSHDNSQNDNSHGGSSSLSSTTTGASASNQQLGSPAALTALHRQQMMARVQRRRLEDAMDDSMNFDYADDMNPQSLEEAMEAEDADSDDSSDVELIEVYGKKASRKYFRDWINTLPPSLHSIYEEETRRLDHREDSPPPLGTLPLKELVRTMHRKEGAIIKYL